MKTVSEKKIMEHIQKKMTLGIAIPVHFSHVKYIKRLVHFFETSTRKPDKVSISISSVPNDDFDINQLDIGEHFFNIIINWTKEKKNPAQNRNIAANALDTDVISFFDADDIPHVNRSEYIMKCFECHSCEVVVHAYTAKDYLKDEDVWKEISCMSIRPMSFLLHLFHINTIIPNQLHPTNSDNNHAYHAAHVSMLSSVFEKVKFAEEDIFFRIEDSMYMRTLVFYGIYPSYLENSLCMYIPNINYMAPQKQE